VPLAKAAARIMLGATIAELRADGLLLPTGDGGTPPPGAPIAVKEAVLPFKRFRTTEGKGVDSLLGPEMKSTGEVMGIDTAFGHAFAKSQAAGVRLPAHGRPDPGHGRQPGQAGDDLPGETPGRPRASTSWRPRAPARVLRRHGVDCEIGVQALRGGQRPRRR
jgi:carbamoyl-phosphate synthase large subunit